MAKVDINQLLADLDDVLSYEQAKQAPKKPDRRLDLDEAFTDFLTENLRIQVRGHTIKTVHLILKGREIDRACIN